MRRSFVLSLAVAAGLAAPARSEPSRDAPSREEPPKFVVRPGAAITVVALKCSSALDCWLARRITPAAWTSPRKALVLERVTSPTIGKLEAAAIGKGELNRDDVPVGLFTLDGGAAKVSAGIAVVPITVHEDGMQPDHYVGTIHVSGEGLEATDVPFDLNLRTGPLGPLLWLIAGVLVGLVFKYWRDRGQNIATSLSALEHWCAIIAVDPAAIRCILEPMLAEAREAKYRRDFDQLDTILTAVEQRRRMLFDLDRLAADLPSRREEIDQIRRMVVRRRDAEAAHAIAALEYAADHPPPDEPTDEATQPPPAPPPSSQPPASGPRSSIVGDVVLWLAQHAAGPFVRCLLITGAVVLGLKSLYIDGGATYGASPFFDGVALFVWGLGTEISTRSFGELGRLLVHNAQKTAK